MNARTGIQRFLREDAGQDMVEYGLVVGLMALASIVSMKSLASTLANTLGAIGNTLTSSS